MKEWDDLKQLVNDEDVAADVGKATTGNKAAGTRVRKKMQEIKAAATAVRSAILNLRADDQK